MNCLQMKCRVRSRVSRQSIFSVTQEMTPCGTRSSVHRRGHTTAIYYTPHKSSRERERYQKERGIQFPPITHYYTMARPWLQRRAKRVELQLTETAGEGIGREASSIQRSTKWLCQQLCNHKTRRNLTPVRHPP